MVFQTINKKLLELGPSLGFSYKKNRVFQLIQAELFQLVSTKHSKETISILLYF